MKFNQASKLVAVLAATFSLCAPSFAEDVEGGKDHPLVGRFEDSTLVEYDAKAFDEIKMLQAPMDTEGHGQGTKTLTAPGWLNLEGKITRLRYENPEKISSLEIMRNYKDALAAKKMEVVFDCADDACNTAGDAGSSVYLKAAVFYKNDQRAPLGSTEPIRYALFKTDSPAGAVYTGILLGNDLGEKVTAYIVVAETKSMDTGKINFLKASELEKAMDSTGKVDLYGIYFDFDKDVVKAESKPTLDEIAKLLTSKPDLKLKVIGHTDNKGQDPYNLDLSKRRAANVASALQSTYGIAADRLASSGEGASRPVAANDTDANRGKNRRVELVKQ